MPEKIYIRLLFLMVFASLHLTLAMAQDGTNPFEIKTRLEKSPAKVESEVPENPFEIKTDTASTSSPVSTTPAPEEAKNPFDLSKQEVLQPKSQAEPTKAGPADTSSTGPTIFNDSNFIFWLILFMLFLLTLMVSLYRQYIVRAYRAFTNDNFLKLVHREQGRIISWPYLSLYIGFIFNAGIFALLVWKYFGLIGGGTAFYLLRFVGIVTAIFIIKHFLLGIVGGIFPVEKELRQYSFMIVIFNIIIGILLVPFNIAIAYGPQQMQPVLIFGAFFVFCLIYLFRLFRSLFLASRYISLHKFHFFMYLCTVEIAPVIILIKLILIEAEIQ